MKTRHVFRPHGSLAALAMLVLVIPNLLQGCGGMASTPVPPTATQAPAPTATQPPAPANTPTTAAALDYWPTQEWRTSTPEEQGIDSQALLAMLQRIEDTNMNVRSLTVIRNGYIVLEAYHQPFTAGHLFPVYSVTKSFTGALTGIAIDEGSIKGLDQPLLDYFPNQWISKRDTRKDAITIGNLLTMQPGLACADDALNYAMEASSNWVQFALDLPMDAQPGQKFIYCTPGPHLLSAVLTKATGMSTADYAQSRLMAPLGIARDEYKWGVDPQGITFGGYGLELTPRDMAKFGLLYLNNGRWDGKQVVPASWATASGQVHALGNDGQNYGYLFWVYPDFFAAEGYGEQKIEVMKDRNMVVVITSAIDWHKGPAIRKLTEDYIIPAAKSDKPLPPNPTAYRALQARVENLANPVQPVPPLPETAKLISGRAYALDTNPFGWKTLTMTLQEGNPEATFVMLDASGSVPLKIGLDNVYRTNVQPGGSDSIALKGRWEDADTFVIKELQSSPDTQEVEFRLDFAGNNLKINARETVWGAYEYDLTAAAKQ